MAKITITAVIAQENGDEKTSEIIFDNVDEGTNTTFGLEYVCVSEGGPIMRPNEPPTW